MSAVPIIKLTLGGNGWQSLVQNMESSDSSDLDQGYEGDIDIRKIIEGGIRLLNLRNLYFGSEKTNLATQPSLPEIIFLDNLRAKK